MCTLKSTFKLFGLKGDAPGLHVKVLVESEVNRDGDIRKAAAEGRLHHPRHVFAGLEIWVPERKSTSMYSRPAAFKSVQ